MIRPERPIERKKIPHLWHGAELSPAQKMLMFHADSGPVPDTLRRLRETLDRAGFEYVVIGAIAMAVYQYRRATEDVDLCMLATDIDRFKKTLLGTKYVAVEERSRRFRDPTTNVTFDILVSGDLAGRKDRNTQIRFPDPGEAVEVQGLPTVPLPRLIELKLVTWRFKDLADVVELIRRNHLDEGFAERIHPLVRMAYLRCYDQKVEEDRYEREA